MYDLTPVRMAIIKKIRVSVGEDWRKGNIFSVNGNINIASTAMEKQYGGISKN